MLLSCQVFFIEMQKKRNESFISELYIMEQVNFDSNVTDCITLVRDAQRGDRESLSRLTQLAQRPLSIYIYRLTFDHDLTQDLLQETLLQMVKSFTKIED